MIGLLLMFVVFASFAIACEWLCGRADRISERRHQRRLLEIARRKLAEPDRSPFSHDEDNY